MRSIGKAPHSGRFWRRWPSALERFACPSLPTRWGQAVTKALTVARCSRAGIERPRRHPASLRGRLECRRGTARRDHDATGDRLRRFAADAISLVQRERRAWAECHGSRDPPRIGARRAPNHRARRSCALEGCGLAHRSRRGVSGPGLCLGLGAAFGFVDVSHAIRHKSGHGRVAVARRITLGVGECAAGA
jgi:hypothetical protein